MAGYRSLFHQLEIVCLLCLYGSTALADTPNSADILTYPVSSIYENEVHWNHGQSLNVTGCTNISIVINGTTSYCCNAVVLANSSCGVCSEKGLNQCFVDSEITSHSFKDGTNSSCAKLTDFKIQCIACHPLYCPPPGQSTVTTFNPKAKLIDETSNTIMSTPASTPTPNTSTELSVNSQTESTRTSTRTTLTTSEVITSSLQHLSTSPELVSDSSFITFKTESVPDNYSNSTFNETSTERPFDLEKSKKDMYTFLAALGAALLLVLIIVCAFFIRKKIYRHMLLSEEEDPFDPSCSSLLALRQEIILKQEMYHLKSRSKMPIVNISDEFWSSKDYITDPDDGYFCPGASYSVINPVCNTKSYTARNSYLKNEETSPPRYVKTGSIRPSYKSYTPQDENNFKLEPMSGNLSERDRVCSTDDETGVVMDLTKIVSNEIKMQQRAQNIVDRKIAPDRANVSTAQPSSSSGHYRKGKRHKETRQRMRSGQRARNEEANSDQQEYTGDIYAVAYKNRFHEYLDQGSAEESDV